MMMTVRDAVLTLALIGAAGAACEASAQIVETPRDRSSVVAVGSVWCAPIRP